MNETNRCEQLLLQNLAIIERVGAAMARQRGVAVDDISDVVGWVRLRLVEDDYAILRKFRGESAFSTFLTVVVVGLVRDLDVHVRGRWRPSATARRHGPVAIKLEELVYRRRLPLLEAFENLRTAGLTSASDRELRALWRTLPRRVPLRPQVAGADALRDVVDVSAADEALLRDEADALRYRVAQLMHRALGDLPLEDQLMLQMRFWHAMSVADIARTLAVKQKPLYRRMDQLFDTLREQLHAQGITAQQFRDLLGEVS